MPTEEFLSGPSALAAIDAVRTAVRAAGEADPLDEAAELRLRHGLEGIDAFVLDDAFALRRNDELDVAVAPSARGTGLGRRLAGLAAEQPGELTAWSHGDHPAARAIADRLGFHRARDLWVMRRPTAVPLPATELPADVRIRDYGDGDADALLAVNAAAFAHHPEQGSMDRANLDERMAEPWFDPAGLLVADSGPPEHRLLAFHWTKQHSEELGEVYVVAVDPAAQGRGLGRAVTAAGLAHLADLGVRRIILYVESDNEAAIATYSKLGFTHTSTHVQYARPPELRFSR